MRSVDQIIEDAMKSGEFDNLPGKGKPLSLDENPYIDQEWQLAYHLLKQNGFAPEFIDQRQAIELELAAAREALARSWAWRQRTLAEGETSDWVEDEWSKAVSRFKATIERINNQIKSYNLVVPVPKLHRRMINVETERARIEVSQD